MSSLPRSTPSAQGVDAGALLAFVDAVDADPDVEVHSVMIVRHGHVVAEGWWAPHTAEQTRLLYSVSESFTSTALGFAVQEGLVALDDTVVSHLPDLADVATDDRTRAITLRDLAMMAAGHDHDMWPDALTVDHAEPVRGFLSIPPTESSGNWFTYSQPCTYTLGAIIQRRSGMTLTDYLRPRLLDPLGIGQVGWHAYPPGRQLGFTGFFARTEDIAKLGLLYLQGGHWEGRQLLPESYVHEATSAQVATPRQDTVDWQQGYGFQFWVSRHGFRADGAFGQFSIVLPEHDAVVAITAGTESTQQLLDHVWAHLLPAFDTMEPGTEAEATLVRRLGALGLATPSGRLAPEAAPGAVSGTFRLPDEERERPGSRLTSVSLGWEGDSLQVTLEETRNSLTVRADHEQWTVTEPVDALKGTVPVAASYGWTDDGALEIQVVFLETPHRLTLRCSPADRSAHPSWNVVPLDNGGLATLHRPD